MKEEGFIIRASAVTHDGELWRTYRLAITVGADGEDAVDVEHIDDDPASRMTFSFKASEARSCLEYLVEQAKEPVA